MLLLAAAFLALVPQRIVPNDALQPRMYASPSGEWTLFVDPSARDGSGKSTVRIAKQGKTQWTGEKPFTFQGAAIDDTGISAGYAYIAGTEGEADVEDAFVVAVLAPDGKSLLVDETPRESRNESHSCPLPCGRQVLIHQVQRTVIVRLEDPESDSFGECWWSYSLTDAKKLPRIDSTRELDAMVEYSRAFAMAAIGGTPLTLAHWHTWRDVEGRGLTAGNEYALYDADWKLVWSLQMLDDLEREDEDANWRLFVEMLDHGGILDTRMERRFEVRHVAKSERVTYEVAPDASAKVGWSVREIARAPYESGAPKPASKPEIAKLELPPAGGVALPIDIRDSAGPVRDIQAFSIDGDARVTIVRGEGRMGAATLVTLDSAGSVLRQIPVAAIEGEDFWAPDWHTLATPHWLRVAKDYKNDVERIWHVDGNSGLATELPLRVASIKTVAPTPDGGFVAVGAKKQKSSGGDDLMRCAADGNLLWELENPYEEEAPNQLYWPEDVAVAADGSIAVLDYSRELVQVFDAVGKFQRVLELAQAWEHEDTYLRELLLEPGGTFLVHADDVWRRISKDNRQLAVFPVLCKTASGDPCHSGGGTIAPDGKLWSHDSYQVFEFDDGNTARARLGQRAEPNRLTQVAGAFLDGSGRIAFADDRTGSVHLFDSSGKRVLICVPGPEDGSSADGVFTAPDGKIYLQVSFLDDDYLAFTRDGERIGRVQLGGPFVAFDRRDRSRWAAGDRTQHAVNVRHFDAEGALVLELDRRSDGKFFETIHALACGADGRVAVIDGPDDLRDGPGALSLWGPRGEPQRVIELPGIESARHLQLGRRWVVVQGYGPTVCLVSLPDGKCFQFSACGTAPSKTAWTFGLSPDEKELWALEWTGKLSKFALP